jgi:hypothetical protein
VYLLCARKRDDVGGYACACALQELEAEYAVNVVKSRLARARDAGHVIDDRDVAMLLAHARCVRACVPARVWAWARLWGLG